MPKKITDLPNLTSADSGDFIPIVDQSANITKKVAASGLAETIAESFPAGSVTADKLSVGSCTFKGYFGTLQSHSTNTWTTYTPGSGTSGSLSITTTGAPIFVTLEAPVWVSSGNGEIGVQINSTDYELASYSGTTGEARTFSKIISGVPAGTYTINIRLKSSGGSGNNINAFHDVVLSAFEI